HSSTLFPYTTLFRSTVPKRRYFREMSRYAALDRIEVERCETRRIVARGSAANRFYVLWRTPTKLKDSCALWSTHFCVLRPHCRRRRWNDPNSNVQRQKC